jgi:alpha-N-acetylglucosamine transferase
MQRLRSIVILLGSLSVFYLLFWWNQYAGYEPDPSYGVVHPTSSASRYAIATFLTEDTYHTPEDFYFIATRMLTYQLLHSENTRNRRSIPFLVLVTDAVTQEKREQLKRDGAQVILVEDVPLRWWIHTGITRWKDQFTKLRLLEMTEYDRILFIDADTILTRPIDDIFDSPESQIPAKTLFSERAGSVRYDEARLPAQYVFAARSDNALSGEREHAFPPVHANFFSAGFWLVAPSREMFKYVLSVMNHYRRFDPTTMEQSLLNYAFREDGAMPWTELDYHWSATWPNHADLKGGVATLHEKFWRGGPEYFQTMWWEVKKDMESYFSTHHSDQYETSS